MLTLISRDPFAVRCVEQIRRAGDVDGQRLQRVDARSGRTDDTGAMDDRGNRVSVFATGLQVPGTLKVTRSSPAAQSGVPGQAKSRVIRTRQPRADAAAATC